MTDQSIVSFVFSEEKKISNYYFEKKIGYFRDSERVDKFIPRIVNLIIQIEKLSNLDNGYIMLTSAEIFLVDVTPDKPDLGSPLAHLGFQEAGHHHFLPYFEVSEQLPIDQTKEIVIVAKLFILSCGVLSYYYLLREVDGLSYFRLQRTFIESIPELTFFKQIDEFRKLIFTIDNSIGLMFIDIESSSSAAGSVFKLLPIKKKISSMLNIKDENGIIRESISESVRITQMRDGKVQIIAADKIHNIEVLDWARIIDRLENSHSWDLAYTLLEKIFLGQEKRLIEKEGSDVIYFFNDLTESYRSYSLSNSFKNPSIWSDFVYRSIYYSQFFNLEQIVLEKNISVSQSNNLDGEVYDCIFQMIQSKQLVRMSDTNIQRIISYLLNTKGDRAKASVVLLGLEYSESQKDRIVSICYELDLIAPLVNLLINSETSPDFLSCLNNLYRKVLSSKEDEMRHECIISILNVIEIAIQRIIEGHDEKVDKNIFQQVSLWLANETIVWTLLDSNPKGVFRLAELIHDDVFINRLQELLREETTFPRTLLSIIKQHAAISEAHQNSNPIFQNYIYFSLRESEEKHLSLPTDKIIEFMEQINIDNLYQGPEEVEKCLIDIVLQMQRKLTYNDLIQLQEKSSNTRM